MIVDKNIELRIKSLEYPVWEFYQEDLTEKQ